MRWTIRRLCLAFTLSLLAGAAWAPSLLADDRVRGTIAGRGAGGALILHTDDRTTVTIIMSDYTKVRRERRTQPHTVSSALLMPGLRIEASGLFTSPDRFVAERVRFDGADLKLAWAIRDGLTPTDQQSIENARRIEDNAQLIDRQQRTLRQQEQAIAANRNRIRANDEKAVGTTGALATRIGALDDYRVVSTITVYFDGGDALIAPKDRQELEQFAAVARELPGYMVQVEGYAPAVGTSDVNRQLSARRADAVFTVLYQNGIPPTRMLVPATINVSELVAPNATSKGHAENRPTTVTLLQNKATTEK